MKKTIALWLVIAVLTSSCAGLKNSPGNILNILNARWALQSITGQSNLNSLFGNRLPFLQFDTQANSISGNNGCNSITGPLAIEAGNKISFANLASTKMFCPGQGESVFTDALNKITSFKVDNGVLKLLNGSKEMMRFVKEN